MYIVYFYRYLDVSTVSMSMNIAVQGAGDASVVRTALPDALGHDVQMHVGRSRIGAIFWPQKLRNFLRALSVYILWYQFAINI